MNYKKVFKIAIENGHISKKNALRCLNIAKYGRLTCELCGKKMKKFNVDHIVPISKGGTNDINNLRLTHKQCNCVRGNKFNIKDLISLLF